MELEEKEEENEEEVVPPIAITVPHRSWKEESLSHSSSETEASVTSGISLGEAVRHKAALNLEIESWYQLQAELDSSNLTAALETKLGLTSHRSDLTEFPTLEEGVLPSAEACRRQSPGDATHGLLLDIQDSQSSPHFPLLRYSTQGQRFPDEPLLQQSGMIPAVTSTSDCAPKHLVTELEAPSGREDAPGEGEPGVSRSEFTVSDFSIERGHKVTGISPPFNLVGEGSFSVHFAHPNYQSTPGILLKSNVKAEELGVHVIKSALQATTSGSSFAATPLAVKKQLSCTQKEKNKHFESSKLKYPHNGRIQSLPSLSFMEKVKTWNMRQPEEVTDTVTSSDPGGASLRRKASSTAGTSSNNILSTQKSNRDPKDDVAASSRETSSLERLHFHNKNFWLDHPLTRSQSDSAVNISSRNMALAEVLPPASSAKTVQPLEEKSALGEKSHVLGVTESSSGGSMLQKFTAEVVSGSSGEGAGNTGQSSDLNVFVSSEGVAELCKEDGSSLTDGQKNCDALENQSQNLNIPSGHAILDSCSDISSDSLNLPACSGESSQRGLGSAGCSSEVSRHFLPSAKDDNFIPIGTTSLETPKKEELNIEERIPIYLRNLGIHQSPGTILSPFVPRGPIREVEFSPSELRTLKDSTDTLTRPILLPQGKMLSAIETTQTSYNFGTSTPTNSKGGSDILSPCELFPRFSRSSGAKAMNQCSTSCHQPETTPLLPTQREAECSAVSKAAEASQQLQTALPDCHSDREGPMLLPKSGQDLLAKKESEDGNCSPQRLVAGSLAGVPSEVEVDRGPGTSGGGSERNKSQESDSLIASDTLQEIYKLLAQVKDLAGMRCDSPTFSTAASQETGESSSVLIRKENEAEDSRLGKDSIPQFQKRLSWDETTTRSSMQREGSVITPLNSNTGNLRQENSLDVSLHNSEEVMKKMTNEFRTGKSVGRSEPEGCSSVTTDRNQPGFVGLPQSKGISEVSTSRTPELGNSPPSEPLGTVTSVAGGFQSLLSKDSMAGRETGGVQESSSSGDSLSVHVKNLLGHYSSLDPLGSVTDVGRGFQSILSKASSARSKAGSLRESDDSSSGDWLAAHINNPMRTVSPVVPAAPILRSAEEEERKTRAWVKLKLASKSQDSLSDWKEENQQRIEEIKAELLLRAKKSTLAKTPSDRGLEAASEYSYDQEQDMEHSKAPSDKRFQTDEQPQGIRTEELVESNLGQDLLFSRAEPSACSLLKDTQLKSSSTTQSPIYKQHQTLATSHSDTVVELHSLLLKERDTSAMRSTAASDVPPEVCLPAQKQLAVEASSEGTAKQITSVTFSSRKRSRSLLASMALGSSLSQDDLDGIVPLEVDSASTEEQSHGKRGWERSKTCPPSSPMLAGSVSDEIAFTVEKDRFHHVSADSNRAGAYQEMGYWSDQVSVSMHADKSQTLSAKTTDVLPEDVTESGRHSARLMGLDGDTRFSQERSRFNEPCSISSYQQEKSNLPGHIQLYESLEGLDPALQTDLLKYYIKPLEEEKKSPGEVLLTQKEVAREQIGSSHHSSTDEILSTTSVSPSSPTKKVLSCVHITLSPKCSDSELHSDVNTEKELSSRDKPEVDTQPMSSKTPETSTEAVFKLSAADLIPKDQRSSSFPMLMSLADPFPVLSPLPGTTGQELPLQSSERPQVSLGSQECSLKSISNSVIPAKTRKRTSDATTQITTESPGKITFSAEVYVHPQDSENPVQQSSLQNAHGLPSNTASSLNKIAPFPRQPDQPLLLPYKPLGSTGMYYVPHTKAGFSISTVASQTNVERSYSGSNEALPPRLTANMLGLRGDAPADSAAIPHKEGISSKRAKPKLAWAEEQMKPLEASPEHTDHLKSVKPTDPVIKPAQFYLHHPPPMDESSFPSNSELSEDSSAVGHPKPSSSAVSRHRQKAHGHQHVIFVGHKRGGENDFFPLPTEADYSKNEDLNVSMSVGNETSEKELLQRGRREAEQKAARDYPLTCSQMSRLHEKEEKDLALRQRTHSSGSLDELWMKFLECRKRHQHHNFQSNGELSLVERLDRLARLLQNPIKYTFSSDLFDSNVSEEKIKGGEQKKTRLPEKDMSESTSETPPITHDKKTFVELRKSRSGKKITCHKNDILEHQEDLETPSDTSSEARLSRDQGTSISFTSSESDGMTQTEMESATQTEGSSSISTIDTVRLIRTFGPDRVKLSPKCCQLYRAISHQKSRSGKRGEGHGNTVDVEHPKVTSERLRKRKELQQLVPSTSGSSSSWGPSSALIAKRRTRMLNKGIQAGHLEIVNSATKKNTRDVGVTFPTPRSSQANQQPQECWHCVDGIFGESDGIVTDHQAAGSQGKQKEQPGNLVGKSMKRSRLHLPQAISWFIQAEDLKSESRKENQSSSFAGPGPSWFEPWSSTKPWREPLREKNWQEQQHRHLPEAALPERGAETRSLRPYVKLTLQEALAVHRPDFISRSGERVKHLKLVMQERRMQSVLQFKRGELFNPPVKRKGYRIASHMLSERGFLCREKRGTIPRSEMVQRSKRIYEQLPEVQKKREEEKRRVEYNSYRLKAQLYQKKITNHVLGRKVPWH